MIKILKLVTGEELIATVKENNDGLLLDKPCVLQMVPSRADPQQPQMALIPYAAYTVDHAVTVSKSSVVWTEEPVKELYNQYNTIFGSGLVVPSGGL